MTRSVKIVLAVVVAVVVLLAAAVATIYLWPHESAHRQTGTPETVSYDQAVSRIDDQVAHDTSRGVTEACQSTLLTHGDRTAETVVFFHGVRMCPNQFDEITQYFFEQGYNVYTPVAPAHGTADPLAHAEVRADDLVDYVNESVTTATGLGEEVGVVGLSGGGLLGTWAAQYRPEVERLLLLSAFYEPSTEQAPKWQLPLLKVLYGKHLIPDAFSNGIEAENPGFSYRALAQYLILGENLQEDGSDLEHQNLRSIGTIVAEDDNLIDHELAESIPATTAAANGVDLMSETIPGEWQIGHEITGMNVAGFEEHRDELFQLYLDYYRGSDGVGLPSR